MKKKRIWISLVLIFSMALLMILGLFYFEKKDRTESSAMNRKTAAETESEGNAKAESETSESAKAENTVQPTETPDTGIPIEPSQNLDSEMSQDKETSLIFTGDVYLSSYVLSNYDKSGINGVLDQDLQKEFSNADIVMVNEEFPFGTGGTAAEDKQFTFRVDPKYVSILQNMNVDLVSLANNHVLDFGTSVLEETFQTLDKAGIGYAGAGTTYDRAKELQIVTENQKKYGFLSASRVFPTGSWNAENNAPGVFSTYDSAALVKAVSEARAKCDFLTVFVHWGIERHTTPEDYQKNLAHAYIDAGADLVIGSHPHVLQGVEYYKGKPIFYSLGNFIFNQTIDKTMMVKIVTNGDSVSAEVIPAYAQNGTTKKLSLDQTGSFDTYLQGLSTDNVQINNGKVSEKE